MKNYDTILYVVPNINEDNYWGGHNIDDPKLYSNYSFGKAIQSDLNNMGDGFFAEVTDFGKWVTIDVSYHNYITGKTLKKTFLVVFSQRNEGIILSAHSKWRTINGYSQASSYIKSVCNALKGDTQTKL